MQAAADALQEACASERLLNSLRFRRVFRVSWFVVLVEA